MRRLLVLGLVALTGCTGPLFVWGGHHAAPIVNGGQEQIDAGYVVNYSGCDPDNACTVWLAGHRSSHGAVFHDIPSLEVGDIVQILDRHDHRYRITHMVIRSDRGLIEGDLVIQTSLTGGRVLLVYATQISADPLGG